MPGRMLTGVVPFSPACYMPVSLVTSQFAALERPENEERVSTVAADTGVDAIVQGYLAELSVKPGAPQDGPPGNDNR